jgi:hypothetical protein
VSWAERFGSQGYRFRRGAAGELDDEVFDAGVEEGLDHAADVGVLAGEGAGLGGWLTPQAALAGRHTARIPLSRVTELVQ